MRSKPLTPRSSTTSTTKAKIKPGMSISRQGIKYRKPMAALSLTRERSAPESKDSLSSKNRTHAKTKPASAAVLSSSQIGTKRIAQSNAMPTCTRTGSSHCGRANGASAVITPESLATSFRRPRPFLGLRPVFAPESLDIFFLFGWDGGKLRQPRFTNDTPAKPSPALHSLAVT